MAGPLGVGVGDLIAVSKLCLDIIEYISNVREAHEVFEKYVIKLRSMSSTFEIIAHTLTQFQSTTLPTRTPSISGVDQQLRTETQSARVSLENAAAVLAKGYQGKKASASLPGVRRFWKLSRWPKTCQRFEEHLDEVHESMRLVLLLLEIKNITITDQLTRSFATLELEINRRPPQMSLPGSGGSPEDHIQIEDGLGTTKFLPLDICSNPNNLHTFLEIMLDECPGEERINQRHYKLYNGNFDMPIEVNASNWAYYVQSGSKLLLAFVVGTWRMSMVNFCPNCNYKNPGEWYKWRNCRCGLSYFVTEAGEVDYEPYDGCFGEAEGAARVWKRSTQKSNNYHATNEEHQDQGSHAHAALNPGVQELQTTSDKFQDEELYLKRQILVYDPIFNFIHRNMVCRCIVGMTSIKSMAPRVEINSMDPCTKHQSHRTMVGSSEESLSLDLDYQDDEYFKKFGGYHKFLAAARIYSAGTIIESLVNIDSLCSHDDACTLTKNLTADEQYAVDRYRYEVWESCKWRWDAQRESYESRPNIIASTEDWFRTIHEDLTYIATEVDKERVEGNQWRNEYFKDRAFITVLEKGRIITEMVDLSDTKDVVS